jgi:hypothetical protein
MTAHVIRNVTAVAITATRSGMSQPNPPTARLSTTCSA